MGYQVITDYTEVDPDSRITRYTNYVTYSGWNAIYDSYVYRDFGANYFNKIDIYFRLKASSADHNDAQVANLAFKNTLACIKSGGGLALAVTSYRVASGSVQIRLITYSGITAEATDSSASYVTLGNYYYCRLVRASGSTTATLYIYTDSARTSLWDTLSITHDNVATQYQYLYAVAFIMTGYGYGLVGETGNVTLPTEISGQLPGASVLSATGKITSKINGGLAGLSTFSAALKRQLKASGSLPAIGDLGASIQRIMKASGSIDGLADLYSSLKLSSLLVGQIAGESLLSATGNMTAICSGELAGLGALSAEAKSQLKASGSLPAIGDLGASIQRIMMTSGSIDGLTELNSILKLFKLASGQMAAESLLSATGNMTAICSGELAGLGALSAEARSQIIVAGSMPATGALEASVRTLMKASGSIDGRTGIWVYRAGDDIFLCNAIILKCDLRGNYRMSAILTDVQYVPFKQARTQPWAASYIIPPDVNADDRRS